jgi:hypothetical protein
VVLDPVVLPTSEEYRNLKDDLRRNIFGIRGDAPYVPLARVASYFNDQDK